MNAEKYNIVVPGNIGRLIKERGLKQGAVAEWAGYSRQQFSDMLNGRKIIKPCDLLAIADAIGVSINDLFADGRDSA